MLALAVSLSVLCLLGGIDALGIPKTFNASNVYLLKPDAYIKARLYAQYPTESPDNFRPYIPGSPNNDQANGYFPHFPMTVTEALSRNWTVYGGGLCVPQKGIPYLPPDSINYYNNVTGQNLNPFAVYYDSKGFLNGIQIYLNYSTCCDNRVCGCESARAGFPVQRYYYGAPFLPFDPILCPTCVSGPAYVQTNDPRAAFPGKETVNHHFVYFSFRDPDVVCSANTTEFYSDRVLVGFAVPNTTLSSFVGGFVYFPMYYFPTPVGYFDTQSCVPFMGVHVQVFPVPTDIGGFAFFSEYSSLDPQKKNIGIDMLFSGRNQNNPYLENFVRFFNLPEPCSSLHIWFGSFLDISDVCVLDPAAAGSPVADQFTIYRPISGDGNNLAHSTWGAEGRPYRNRVRDAQVRGYAFDYHAHWGNDSSWKPYLDACSQVTRSLSISYIDGGGSRPVPSFLHIWTFGDPVYFCKNLLTNLKNSGNPGFSWLNLTIISQAPVMPQPREVSNQLFSRSPERTDRFTNDLHSFWAFFVVTDVTNSARDTAEMGLYYYPPCDRHRDTKCSCCSAPLTNPGACIFGQPYCWVFIGRLVDQAWLTDFQYPPFQPISNTNPRQVWNENTHYLDLSQVYGGGTTTMLLRNSTDPAYMAVGQKVTVYPFFAGTSLARGDLTGTQWDLRGDYRANKAPPMKVLTDTFLNNHNRLVGLIDDSNYNNVSKYRGPLGRFFLFEDARRLNIAYYQRIIFREYLGALLGRPLNPYDTNADGNASSREGVETYNEEVDPSLDVTFAHLAYRYAHTELNSNLQRLDSNFDSSTHPDVLLRDSWFNTTTVSEYATAPEDFLRGLVASRQAAAGAWAVDDVRNFMFNDWNTGADLISTDLFRGRDVGLPTINDIRAYYKLKPYASCSDFTTDAHAIEIVYSLYGPDPLCIERIDPYVVGFLEPLLPQSALGETFWHIVFDQFTRLRNGDRFYFENLGPSNPNPLTPVELAQVYSNTLEQTFVDNWEDIQLGQLGSGIFFLKQRQLQTLSLGGNFNSLNFLDYTPPEFEFAQFLKLSPTYGIWWFIDHDELTVRYQTASLGWVGFGIEPDLNTMKNADIYFCQLWPNLTAQITDRYALDVGPPKLDIDLGGEDNILRFHVEHIDGNTICQFTRKLNTGDQWDKPIIKGLRKHMFAFNPETNDLVYHGPTRQSNVYFDFYKTYPVETASEGIVIVYGVLGGLCILFALFIFLSILKQEEYFKFMSPLFCQLLCFGAMVCVSSVFPLMQQPPSQDACYAYPWLLGIGFAIMFGCLFAKTWRLWRLFSTKSLKAQVISNKMVFGVIALFVVPMVAFLIIWSSVDGFTVEEQYSTTQVGSVRFICDTPRAWWPIFAAMVAFVILIGCVLTFLIRNLPPEFNDAEPIGFSMYNALLMFIAGTAIGWGISDNINAVVSAQGFPVLFLVWFTLVVLFVPTLWRMWVTKKEPQSFQSSMAMRSGGSNVSGLNTSTSADS